MPWPSNVNLAPILAPFPELRYCRPLSSSFQCGKRSSLIAGFRAVVQEHLTARLLKRLGPLFVNGVLIIGLAKFSEKSKVTGLVYHGMVSFALDLVGLWRKP